MARELQMKSIVNLLAYLAVFLVPITFFTSPFEGYFFYIVMICLYPILILSELKKGKRLSVNKSFVITLFSIGLLGVMSILFNTNSFGSFLKNILGITFAYVFYYLLLKYNEFDYARLFSIYIKGAILIATIGILQLLSYKLDFRLGYDYSWLLNKWKYVQEGGYIRVNSITQEPAHMIKILCPALFISIHKLFFGNRFITYIGAVIILLATVISFSSLGMIAIFFCLLLLTANYFKPKYIVYSSFSIPFVIYTVVTYMEGFTLRLESAINILKGETVSIQNVDLSTFTLYNNFVVGLSSFKQNILIGGGLGSHPVSFKKYSLLSGATELTGYVDLNTQDAASFFTRTMSEFGSIGLVAVFIFLFKFYVRRNKRLPKEADFYWLISNSILVLFIMSLIRYGHYFLYGLPIFIFTYYYNKKYFDIYKLRTGI